MQIQVCHSLPSIQHKECIENLECSFSSAAPRFDVVPLFYFSLLSDLHELNHDLFDSQVIQYSATQ